MMLATVALVRRAAIPASIWAVKSAWETGGDVASFFLALGTLWLAASTRRVARETKQLSADTRNMARQEDEHHKKSFMPICVVVPNPGAQRSTQRGGIVSRRANSTYPGPGGLQMKLQCEVACTVQNVGVGPALNVLMTLRLTGLGNAEGVREMGFIGIGGSGGESHTSFLVDIDVGKLADLPDDVSRSNSVANQWEIDLKYQDVFGQTFATHHTSNPNGRWADFRILAPSRKCANERSAPMRNRRLTFLRRRWRAWKAICRRSRGGRE